VYASLKERENGARVTKFNSGVYENSYRRHVVFLEKIRSDGPNKFHAMMHRIYVKVRSVGFHFDSVLPLTTPYSGGYAHANLDGKEFSSLPLIAPMRCPGIVTVPAGVVGPAFVLICTTAIRNHFSPRSRLSESAIILTQVKLQDQDVHIPSVRVPCLDLSSIAIS
jgi:hypothetical protein